MAIDVAPPKCPKDACPGKKCKMEQVMSINSDDPIKYKPVCVGKLTQKRSQKLFS